MPKLTDDPRVQALIDKAEARGAKQVKQQINAILGNETAAAGELEDPKHKKAVKTALATIKARIRTEV